MPPASTTSCELLGELVAREDVALGVSDGAIERAEAAARRADVRVVDVAVDDVRDHAVGVLALADRVGREAEIEEAPFGEEALPFGAAQTLALRGAREQGVERRARRRRATARFDSIVVEEADALDAR